MNNRKRNYSTDNVPGRSGQNRRPKIETEGHHFGNNRGLGNGSNYSNVVRNKPDEPYAYNPFGLKRFIEFLTQTNDEVIMAVDKSKNNFRQNLRRDSGNDMMILLIQLIGEKICGESSLLEIQNQLVVLCTESMFLERILKFTSQIPSLKVDGGDGNNRNRDNIDSCPARILGALASFYACLCLRMPAFAADKLLPYVQGAHNITELLSLKGVLTKVQFNEIDSRLANLEQDIRSTIEMARKNPADELRKKVRKRYELTSEDREKLYQMTPPDKFNETEIIPSKEEILSDEEPFVRPNLIVGKYPSALTYLDVQFRLVREDFLAPLRESVKQYSLMNAEFHTSKDKRPAPGTIRIYRDVELHQVQCTTEVTLFTMKFSTANLKRVKWETSKRFLTGSLLLLTPDRFENIYFATVGRRDERKLPHGLIDIIWEGTRRPDTYNNVTFLMIECEVYFESYRHTLKALQDIAAPSPPLYDRSRFETCKMYKYIVNVCGDKIPPAEYLRSIDWNEKKLNFKLVLDVNQAALKLTKDFRQSDDETRQTIRKSFRSFEINPLELSAWPSAIDLGMDMPQYAAFQSAITRELAIIQGPPGTGKTYIGLQIMKLLLSNWHTLDIQAPILVVCYTNHALDQFLEGILSIMESLNIDPYGKLVRVGGQSKVDDIQQYNIRNIRNERLKQKMFDANYASLRLRTRRELLLQQDYRSDLKSLFADLCNPDGIINFGRLNEQITDLASIIPSGFASIFFSNGGRIFDFLRLNNSDFESERFSAEHLVKRWFGLTATRPSRAAATPQVVEEADTPDTELDDEEIRNILVAHRMEEEILEEVRTHKAEALHYHLCYAHDAKFKSSEAELFSALQKAEQDRNYKQVKQFQGKLYELGLQRNKFMNQCNFVKVIQQSYCDGRINLPKVTPDMLAEANASLWRLSLTEKWAIYFHIVDEIKKYLLQELVKIEASIMDAQKRMEEVKNQGDGFILQGAQVVGMTTTGAAKYNVVLRMMKSKIVIVEEAAEVLEAHIVTSITEHCEHLILIGDHQQLRPPTTVYKLAKDYQLDVSLFERLIKNNISWTYLRAQHRMRPDICQLLVPTIYRDLENHVSVESYPPVKGLSKNLFFVNHSHPEKEDNDSMTKSNEYEAQYLTQLCRHLLLQGYKTSQITILTTYIGQMFLIKKLMKNEGDTCTGVRVTVVDNFQGEENDIILLSLVRSNEENKIGFLRTDNRICVALSRAKQGFYMVGNMDCLVNSPSNTWQEIFDKLNEQKCIGPGVLIQCPNHEEIIEINSPEQFRRNSPEGGCTKMCPGVLPRCDHACRKICHAVDSTHELYQCKYDCERRCPDPERHKCPNMCYIYPCRPCQVTMKRSLPCGHDAQLPCHVDFVNYSCELLVLKQLKCEHRHHLPCSVPIESHRCTIKVTKNLECGHTKLLPCHVPITQYECVETVTKELDCGHEGVTKCIDDPSKFICDRPTLRNLPCGHEQTAPCKDDIPNIKCQTLLEKVHPDCKHHIHVPCHQIDKPKEWNCSESCDTRLNCGHQCIRKCHLQNDPMHLNYSCEKSCARSCENDHKCRKKHPCHLTCEPCKIPIEKTLKCGHRLNMVCSADAEKWQCMEICHKKISLCGHECLKKCYMPCDPCTALTTKKSIDCTHTTEVMCSVVAEKRLCNELVASSKMSLCGHIVKVPCQISETCSPEDCLQYCHTPCNYKFDYDGGCGHTCQGNCASCYQGKIHIKCASKCERVLACGHVCKFPCSRLCPPCKDVCILRCIHSKCKKTCGEPCIDCKESCKWSCEHLQCRKKCSEMCNRKPCDEPCKKKLKCGHDCIGCCGEQCPPFCRSCNKEVVQEFLFGEEDEDDARFVYLEKCQHIIHRESMDKWMSQSVENAGGTQITAKRCPKCNSIIENNVRYGNIIKKQFNDVLGIRKKIYGNSQAQKRAQNLIAQKIQRLGNQDCQFDDVKESLERKIFEMRQKNTKHGRTMVLELINVDQYTFESLHNMVLWWEEAENNMKPIEINQSSQQRNHRSDAQTANKPNLLPDSRNELLKMYKKLFGILLSRNLPLSSHEINDFDREFCKLHDLFSLGLRRGIQQFDSFAGSLEKYSAAHKHIMRNQPYDDKMQKITENYLKELEDIIKAGWELVKKRAADVRANRESIFSAMGFAGNHWYRCPNGHLYVVANCGALNEAGTCPECHNRIGGGTNGVAVRNDTAIQQQINNVVDIYPETYTPPVFNDRSTRANRNHNRGRGRHFRGRRN